MAFAAGLVVLVGAALATPGVGILVNNVTARGVIDDGVIVNSKSGIHLKTKGPVGLVTHQIVIGTDASGQPGHTGWHSHPGPVLVTVKEGSLKVIYVDDLSCQGTVYSKGDSFIDRGDENVHIARNVTPNGGSVELWATYLVPGAGPGFEVPNALPAFRLDQAEPGTGC